jgi:hypothetical protein
MNKETDLSAVGLPDGDGRHQEHGRHVVQEHGQ